MEGKLEFNQADKRWEIISPDGQRITQLSSGSVCEIKVADHWIRIRIEHGPKGYYATVAGVELFAGQPARLA